MSARRLMRSRGVLERPTRTEASPGRWVEGWEVVARDVACKADPLALADEQHGVTFHGELGYRLFVPTGTPIERGHRFTVNDIVMFVRSVEPTGGVAFGQAGGHLRCVCVAEQLATSTPGES